MSIEGHVEPGFEPVAAAFERNFAEHDELGASFAAVRDGRPVVDLWGGAADAHTGRPWTASTLQLVFSGTKGVVAACLLMLVDRGALDLDAPVARYWPEFAAAGKERIHVADVLSHRAGLPGLATPLNEWEVADDLLTATRLAAQAPFDDPRARETYHPLTFGWLCGELLRRIDGRSLGRFVAEEIAEPLELELWIGLPEALESRVAVLELAADWHSFWPNEETLRRDPLLAATLHNPPLAGVPLPWNTRAWHAAEIPAGNAIATARSLARFYGCLARGGEIDGVRLLSEETLRLGRRRLVDRVDALTLRPSAFGAGFMLQTGEQVLGPPTSAFGHDGMGGSCHGAWPAQQVGFSYAMNRMRNDAVPDPRSKALLEALFASVETTACRGDR